jgi:hypothetical protein
MKKGDLITGVLCGFTYVGKEVKYCRVSVRDADGIIHKGIAGTAELFPFVTMLSLKGADASVQMVYDGQATRNEVEYAQYKDIEFTL